MENVNGYELSRKFFNWSFENPEKIKPLHSAIYFFAVEHCNRLGWKDKFGFPSQMVMEAIGVRNWKTYIKGLNDLVDFGFIEVIEKSTNQYSSNIIAIVKNDKAPTKALDKALDKALSKHSTKHCTKQGQSTVSIDKQLNKEQLNKEQSKPKKRSHFKKPTIEDVFIYLTEEKNKEKSFAKKESEKMFNYYESKGWLVGKTKMKNWKAASTNWINRAENEFKTKTNGESKERKFGRQTESDIRANREGWENL